ncbi:thiamine-phosphate kinase [Sinobacterium caligoides]|uniref:Thiamine-monophosphate kinase n=1 Tax=Sinobacterium caligoides TaxID=933926 RepID=A0A3N2DPC0_9GAMM|nr:thiamine-phosphate kinase [Sinobacterium caligoides]ROS01626.1 thiamine-phosphate kinase [Sinobacterium caligoides]
MNEFDLIARFFRRQHDGEGVVLDNGDDCAVLDIEPEQQLVVSIDTMVAGVHFLASMPSRDLGYRALATALSDLAAMGAQPRWFTLALTLPAIDEAWLAGFSEGLFELADKHQMALIGGDTTRGPLTISIQVHGVVTRGQYLSRAAAEEGDIIAVTGSLGDAAAGLRVAQRQSLAETAEEAFLLRRFERPTARIEEGLLLRDYSRCAIDISDGLLADLGHICAGSGLGAEIEAALLPCSSALSTVNSNERLEFQLRGGDDYELCVTVARENWSTLAAQFSSRDWPLTKIGRMVAGSGVCVHDGDEALSALPMSANGFKHF